MPLQDYYARRWQVESFSTPGKIYTVALRHTGEWQCSCPHWIYRRAQCKHIEAVMDEYRAEQLAEERIARTPPRPRLKEGAVEQHYERLYTATTKKKPVKKFKITPELFDTTKIREGRDESIPHLVEHTD